MSRNLDADTVASFGREWSRFDQAPVSQEEMRTIFEEYFCIFPWDQLPKNATGFDMGCGSGRWARFVSPRVGHLHCIDPSTALEVAKRNLEGCPNVSFHNAAIGEDRLPPDSQDFGYSLGVLHHVPDTNRALRSCVELLKPGAPFLVYLYYAFDNRRFLFKMVWRLSNMLRLAVSRMPPTVKDMVSDGLAAIIYWPLGAIARVGERLGANVGSWPLSYYRHRSWYTMRTDARDRFGTPLEKRFTKDQIRHLMEGAGLTGIIFSEQAPFWCCVGFKK